jgi:hypothetical protein
VDRVIDAQRSSTSIDRRWSTRSTVEEAVSDVTCGA